MARSTTWTWVLLSGVGLAAGGPISTAFAADQSGTEQDSSGWRGSVNGARSAVGGAAESAGNGVERAGSATKGALGTAGNAAGNAASTAGNAVGGAARHTGNAAESQAQESDRQANDMALATDVKGNLSKQGSDASNINVDAKHGVVTLTGAVRSRAESEQAETAARQTSGVKSVKNDLKVKSAKP